MSDLRVRPETPADHDAIYRINALAFDRTDEAVLVDRLRAAGVVNPNFSLVATRSGVIIGHILFTPVEVVGNDGAFTAWGLGPMAVHPEAQRQGIGGQLIATGLAACRKTPLPCVFVLGHPAYYPRFGFRPAPDFGFHFSDPSLDPYFMVFPLTIAAFPIAEGVVAYHPAFSEG